MSNADPWSEVPVQTYKAPSCPFCGDFETPIPVRTDTRGDTATRKLVCRRCSQRYLRVIEYFHEPEQPGGDSLDYAPDVAKAVEELRRRKGLPKIGSGGIDLS